jgi:hypothetical protein
MGEDEEAGEPRDPLSRTVAGPAVSSRCRRRRHTRDGEQRAGVTGAFPRPPRAACESSAPASTAWASAHRESQGRVARPRTSSCAAPTSRPPSPPRLGLRMGQRGSGVRCLKPHARTGRHARPGRRPPGERWPVRRRSSLSRHGLPVPLTPRCGRRLPVLIYVTRRLRATQADAVICGAAARLSVSTPRPEVA